MAVHLQDFRDRLLAIIQFVAEIRTDPDVGNVFHSGRINGMSVDIGWMRGQADYPKKSCAED